MNEPIKTEFFVNEFDVEMRKDTYLDAYGKEVTVTMPVNQPEPVEPEPTSDPVMEKLDSIEAKIQTNEDLQTFYDDIVKEVGL